MAMFNAPDLGRGRRRRDARVARALGRPGSERVTRGLPPLKLQVALARGEVVEMSGDCSATPSTWPRACSTMPATTKRWPPDCARRPERAGTRALSQPRSHAAARPRRAGACAPARGRRGASATPQPRVRRHRGRARARRHPPRLARPEPHLHRRQPAGGAGPQPAGHLLHRRQPRVSRSHARIDWHGGTFQLTDLSYNGTYVRFANDPEIVSLRRGTCTLHGSGMIGAGRAAGRTSTAPDRAFRGDEVRRHPAAARREFGDHLEP